MMTVFIINHHLNNHTQFICIYKDKNSVTSQDVYTVFISVRTGFWLDQVCFVKNKQVALMADRIYFPKAFQSRQKNAFSHTQQVAFSINGLHSSEPLRHTPDISFTTLCIQYFVYTCQSALKSIITFTDCTVHTVRHSDT